MQVSSHVVLSKKEMNHKTKIMYIYNLEKIVEILLPLINLCRELKQETNMLYILLYILHDRDEFQYLDYA